MIYGLDTTILVQLELADHEMHARAARLRDRLLNTLLAATYSAAGIAAVVTSNTRDYRSFIDTVLTP